MQVADGYSTGQNRLDILVLILNISTLATLMHLAPILMFCYPHFTEGRSSLSKATQEARLCFSASILYEFSSGHYFRQTILFTKYIHGSHKTRF